MSQRHAASFCHVPLHVQHHRGFCMQGTSVLDFMGADYDAAFRRALLTEAQVHSIYVDP